MSAEPIKVFSSEENLERYLSSAGNHYLDDDTKRFFRSRVQAVGQAGPYAAVLWETMGAGFRTSDGRIHKVSLFTFHSPDSSGFYRGVNHETLYHGGESGVGVSAQAKQAKRAFDDARASGRQTKNNPASTRGNRMRTATAKYTVTLNIKTDNGNPRKWDWSELIGESVEDVDSSRLSDDFFEVVLQVKSRSGDPRKWDWSELIGEDEVTLVSSVSISEGKKVKNPMRSAKDDGSPIPVAITVIALDETEYYNIDPEDAPYIEKILGCYAFDRNQHTYLASTQPSYWLRHLYTSVWLNSKGQALSEDRQDEIHDKYAYCENNDDYYDAHEIDRLVEKLKNVPYRVHIDTEEALEDTEDQTRQEKFEELCEHFQGNGPVG